MEQIEFDAGTAKLKAFYRGVGDDWGITVYQKHGHLPAEVWAKAVELMLERREDKGVPAMWEINKYIGMARDAGVGPARSSLVCGRCAGDKFIPNDQQLASGYLVRAVAPCPTCNRSCPVEGAKFPEGSYYTVREPEVWTTATVKFLMSVWDVELDESDPEGAKYLFLAMWRGTPKPKLRGWKRGALTGMLDNLQLTGPVMVAARKTNAPEVTRTLSASESSGPVSKIQVKEMEWSDEEKARLNAEAEAEDVPF